MWAHYFHAKGCVFKYVLRIKEFAALVLGLVFFKSKESFPILSSLPSLIERHSVLKLDYIRKTNMMIFFRRGGNFVYDSSTFGNYLDVKWQHFKINSMPWYHFCSVRFRFNKIFSQINNTWSNFKDYNFTI